MFSFIQRKIRRSTLQANARNAEQAAQGATERPECPPDLTTKYQDAGHVWIQRVRATTTLEHAQYDRRLGALHLTLPGRHTLTLAVSDHVNAEQIHSMARLEPCHVRLRQDGPHLTAIVSSASWTYAVTGLPALTQAGHNSTR